MISAFSKIYKKYYTTVLFKEVLKPTEHKKIKRPHVHINVLTFTSHFPGFLLVCNFKWKQVIYRSI